MKCKPIGRGLSFGILCLIAQSLFLQSCCPDPPEVWSDAETLINGELADFDLSSIIKDGPCDAPCQACESDPAAYAECLVECGTGNDEPCILTGEGGPSSSGDGKLVGGGQSGTDDPPDSGDPNVGPGLLAPFFSLGNNKLHQSIFILSAPSIDDPEVKHQFTIKSFITTEAFWTQIADRLGTEKSLTVRSQDQSQFYSLILSDNGRVLLIYDDPDHIIDSSFKLYLQNNPTP